MGSFFNRLKNIVSANANKALSAAESKDPAAIAEDQIRQHKEQVARFESAVKKLGSQKIGTEKDIERLKGDVKDWGKKAEMAMEEGNETLAEKALERQTQMEQELSTKQAFLKTTAAQYDKTVKTLKAKKEQIQQIQMELSSLKARQEAAKANLEMQKAQVSFEGNGCAIDQIDLMKKKVGDMENEATAGVDLAEDMQGEDIDAQFEKLESSGAVNDKMAALKAKMAKKKEDVST